MIFPERYPPALAQWATFDHPPHLGPGQPNPEAKALLDLTIPQAFEGVSVKNSTMARACLAGLLLRLDFLDSSHRLTQDIETPTGSFWHGIMHRREPDFGNSKYWFRQVGQHPILEELRTDAAELGFENFTPGRFVDAVQTGEPEALLQAVQEREWALLFEYSFKEATGQ